MDELAKSAFHEWIAEYPWNQFITFTFKNTKYGAPPYKRVISSVNRLNKIVNNLNFMALATEREDWSIKQTFLVLERGKLPPLDEVGSNGRAEDIGREVEARTIHPWQITSARADAMFRFAALKTAEELLDEL